jgi:hypothetical protein
MLQETKGTETRQGTVVIYSFPMALNHSVGVSESNTVRSYFEMGV